MQKPPLHGYRTLFTFSIARIRHVVLASLSLSLSLAWDKNRRKYRRPCFSVERARAIRRLAGPRTGIRGRVIRELARGDACKVARSIRRSGASERASAKVENRHGSLGNKMRAPALPRGWGPLDNPYCTPHPLVLLSPLRVRPSRRRPWPYIPRSAGRVLSGLAAPERNAAESICGGAARPKFLKNGGRAAGNFREFSI